MKCLILTSMFGLLAVGALVAQEVPRFSFDIGAGFTQPVGSTGRYLDDGWNIQAGMGYNFTSYVGAMLQVDYNSLGVNSSTLGNVGFGNGNLDVFSATIDPIVHLNPRGHVDPYIIGGGGLYHQYQSFGSAVPGVINPYPFFAGSPTAIGSYSVNRPGANIGAGIAFGTKWHGKIFAEARWDHIFLNNGLHTDYVPISFGYRW
jgi:hypothetical protein